LAVQPPPKKKSFKQEYAAFLIAFGVIGIAIGFVIGQAVNKLVTALVRDIVDPTIGLFLPGSLENMSATVIGIHGGPSEFKYGDLISNIIDFSIIALLVFLANKMLSKYKLIEDKTKPEEKK
jgi:large conductance mechanosensitive channel